MDIRTKIYSALSTIAAMTAIMACSEIDNVANNHYLGDGRISFSASTAAVDGGTMRSAEAKTQNLTSIAAQTDDGKTLYLHTTVTPIPVDTAATTMRGTKTESVASIKDFGVTAYKTTNAFAADLTTAGTQHFDNVKAKTSGTPSTSSEWNTYKIVSESDVEDPYYWPENADKLSFFAYSPYDIASFGTSTGKVTLSYTADETIKEQKDLLIAAAFDESRANQSTFSQSLTFKHALTAVTFEAAADLFPCTITKVSLSGIPTTNTYTYATATGASYGTWGTTGSNVKTFDFPLNVKVTSSTATLTSDTDETTLLMVPQTLPSGATATIEFTDAALRKHKLSYSLAGQLWEAGKQVKYTLSSSSITSIQIDFAEVYAQQSGSDALGATMPSFKTSFAASNEAVGLYIVDIVNHKIVGSNIKVNVSSAGEGTIETNGNLSTQSFLSDQTGKYKYFAYYPYKDAAGTYYTYTELTGLAAGNATTTTSEASAEAFFKDYIASWTPPTTQNTLAIIDQYDLQAGETTSISGGKLTIKLRHQMGLAAIAMASSGTSSHEETRTLDGNTTNTKYSSTSTTEYYALDEFSDNGSYCKPYKVGTRNTANLRCYFLVNPAKSYTFSTTYKYADADAQRQWDNFSVSSTSNTVNAGKYRVVTTPTPKFKNLGRLYSYSATVIPQTFKPAFSYLYQFQCWGGAGGRSLDQGSLKTNTHSLGGYVTGDMTLTANERTFYLAVGAQGSDAIYRGSAAGGWPGGGKGYPDAADDESGGGGGGFSAVYLDEFTKSTATDFNKLKTRIMVAGAGGGCSYGSYYGTTYMAGSGGGLSGIGAGGAAAGTQDSGYSFGVGMNAADRGNGYEGGDVGSGGGGGGYWGGRANNSGSTRYYNQGHFNGAGGSSFASGMTGCKAICLILNKVDTKSLKKYGERTQRKPLCERH